MQSLICYSMEISFVRKKEEKMVVALAEKNNMKAEKRIFVFTFIFSKLKNALLYFSH